MKSNTASKTSTRQQSFHDANSERSLLDESFKLDNPNPLNEVLGHFASCNKSNKKVAIHQDYGIPSYLSDMAKALTRPESGVLTGTKCFANADNVVFMNTTGTILDNAFNAVRGEEWAMYRAVVAAADVLYKERKQRALPEVHLVFILVEIGRAELMIEVRQNCMAIAHTCGLADCLSDQPDIISSKAFD